MYLKDCVGHHEHSIARVQASAPEGDEESSLEVDKEAALVGKVLILGMAHGSIVVADP